MRRCTVAGSCRFLSTLSLRRATRGRNPPPRTSTISIHALLAESDGGPGGKNAVILHFYPRSPCGERPPNKNNGGPGGKFLSTLSLRRATTAGGLMRAAYFHFYPRSPCGERRGWFFISAFPQTFLSTLSLRRATPGSRRRLGRAGHFYPRSPCGERHAAKVGWTLDDNSISIHALLAESDL